MIKGKPLCLLIGFLLAGSQSLAGAHSAVSAANTVQPPRHYTDADGLGFACPEGARLSENPEKDVIARFSSTEPFYAIDLRHSDAPPASDPQAMMKLFSSNVVSKQDHGTILQQDRIACGLHGQITAYTCLAAFRLNSEQLRQKFVFFSDPCDRRLRLLVFTAREADFARLEPTFNRVLQSLQCDHSRSVAVGRHNVESADKLFAHEQVCFAYPHDWNKTEAPDKDTIAKFNCPGSAGAAELSFSSLPAPPGYSTANVAKMIEDEYWSKTNGFKLLKQNEQLQGKQRSIDGTRHMASFIMQNTNANTQLFVFAHNHKFYCLTYTTFGVNAEDAVQQFDRVLASLSCN